MKPLIALTLFTAAIAGAQSAALPEADTLLDQAKAQATAGKRTIFLIFGASW